MPSSPRLITRHWTKDTVSGLHPSRPFRLVIIQTPLNRPFTGYLFFLGPFQSPNLAFGQDQILRRRFAGTGGALSVDGVAVGKPKGGFLAGTGDDCCRNGYGLSAT